MRTLAATLLAVLLLAPASSAQSLEEQLSEFHFARLVFTVTWNTDENRAYVIATAEDLAIEGQSASDLRHCIDGQDCVVPALGAAASGANRDGSVSSDEARDFALNVQIGLGSQQQVRDFLKQMRSVIRIDDKDATSVAISGVGIGGAEGSVDSTKPIHLTIAASAKYGTVLPADQHKVSMQRAIANFTLADRIIINTGKEWRIESGTVQPDQMQQFYTRGRLEGSQEEFQSKDPLLFTVEHHVSHAGAWALWASVGALAVVAAVVGFVLWQRRKV